MTDAPAAEPDQRVLRSKARVLEETHRLLFEGGLGGVSIDEVAKRSGVAKTTIYRHWPTRSALVLDACSKMGGPEPSPDTGSLARDLTILAQRVAVQLRESNWPCVLPSILDAAERDPAIAAMYETLHANNVQPFFAAIGAAHHRGEIGPERDAATLVAQIVGPLFYRRWFSKELIDEKFVTSLVAHALG